MSTNVEIQRVEQAQRIQDAQDKLFNTLFGVQGGEPGLLEQKLEAGRFRKERLAEDKLVGGDMYSGGYVKQYAAGGSVRKANFMDD